jgi:hypothetical protein
MFLIAQKNCVKQLRWMALIGANGAGWHTNTTSGF